MKSSVYILILLIGFIPNFSRVFANTDGQVSIQSAGELFSDGVKAHSSKEYAIAVEKFENVIQLTPNDVSAYYNLGLSNIGAENYGKALWAFEKVLKFSPNDSEANEKAAYCYNQLYPSQDWSPVLSSFEAGLYSISSDTWGFLSILSSILFCISIILLKRKKTLSFKRVMFITSFFCALLLIFSVVFAKQSQDYHQTTNYGIVTSASIPTFIDEKNTAKNNLTEGTRVLLIDKDTSQFIHVQDSFGDKHLVKYEDLSPI